MTIAIEANAENAAVKGSTTFLPLVIVGLLSGCAHPPPPMIPAYDPRSAVEI